MTALNPQSTPPFKPSRSPHQPHPASARIFPPKFFLSLNCIDTSNLLKNREHPRFQTKGTPYSCLYNSLLFLLKRKIYLWFNDSLWYTILQRIEAPLNFIQLYKRLGGHLPLAGRLNGGLIIFAFRQSCCRRWCHEFYCGCAYNRKLHRYMDWRFCGHLFWP